MLYQAEGKVRSWGSLWNHHMLKSSVKNRVYTEEKMTLTSLTCSIAPKHLILLLCGTKDENSQSFRVHFIPLLINDGWNKQIGLPNPLWANHLIFFRYRL